MWPFYAHKIMLTKDNRLVKTADFQTVYKRGRYVVTRQLVVYYLYKANGQLRVGFVASKKIGSSHVRNRCKRMLREVMRQLLPSLLPGYDLVVVARPPLADSKFPEVVVEMAKLLHKAKLVERRK